MSERERADQEPRVSPYLLRPARTYEEYLRDRAIADRLQKQFEDGIAASVEAAVGNPPANIDRPSWKKSKASVAPAHTVARQADRGDSANNQT